MNFLGKHLIVELNQCPVDLLKDSTGIGKAMEDAAVAMGATIVQKFFHQFSPWGVSGVVIIQESHLTIHTWPEYNYAAVDIFTCGELNMEAGVAILEKFFKPQSLQQQLLKRGELPLEKLVKSVNQ